MAYVNDPSDKEESTSDCEDGNHLYQTPHQPRSFCAAANARHGMKDENFLLSQVHRTMTTIQGEVYEAAPAPQQLEDGGQLTTDERIEINLGTKEEPCPTFLLVAC